jgi:methyl acetate hydrolase
MTQAIDAVLQDSVRTGQVPGVVALATTASGTLYAGAAGRRAQDGPPMDPGSLFALHSMTKAITSVCAMQLVEQGRLSLDAPVGEILPALSRPMVLDGFDAAGAPKLRPAATPVTLRRLLSHTAGYGYGRWNADLEAALRHARLGRLPRDAGELARTPLLTDPGTRWNYGINTDVAGLMVEAVSGMRLDAYMRAHVLGPLGMGETGYELDAAGRARLAAMHARGADGRLAPMEWPVGDPPPYCIGGGGLCGTGRDYLRFLRMLLGGGALDGVRILSEASVAEMGRNQIGALRMLTMHTADPATSNDVALLPGIEKTWGLGFMINMADVPGGRSAGSLAWAGLGNTYFWVDRARGVAGVYLTQILPFADTGALAGLAAFERAVYAAL